MIRTPRKLFLVKLRVENGKLTELISFANDCVAVISRPIGLGTQNGTER